MTYEEGLAVATMWQEARGSDDKARLAVAHVIRNRMAQMYTSDGTVAGTVLVPWQFSGWMDATIARESLVYAGTDSLDLEGIWQQSATEPDPTDGAVLYYSPAAMSPPGTVPSWVASSRLTLDLPDFKFYAA